MRVLPYTLQSRFLVGMLFILLITGTLFAFSLRDHMNRLFLSEAQAKASLMVAHTEAIQDYVRNVLRPKTAALIGVDEFIIEAMSSSYVSRRIMGSLKMPDKDFTYRRVAKNARNPDFEVDAKELHFFEGFLKTPEAEWLEEIAKVRGREQLVVARPVYFDASCMRCHGDAKDAPAVLLTMYGSERGFGRYPGELAGLNIISVPVESATGAVSRSVTVFAMSFLGGMLLLLLLAQGFFNRLVVHNLRRVGHILHQKFFLEDENRDVLAPLRKEEEIEGMIRSIEAVAIHLSEARRQLSDYARNLEAKVRERTVDLEAAMRARNADVQLFMRLLSDLNKTQEKRALLKTTIRLIAEHFAASRVAYVCGMKGSEEYTIWPATEKKLAPEEQKTLHALLAQGKAAVFDHEWYVPVQTSGQTRGMLALYWADDERVETPGDADAPGLSHEMSSCSVPAKTYLPLALALGRQLGIALDNFDALDVLLRQNSLLDSVVDGVNDPLILVEHDMAPVLANASARALARRLLPVSGEGGSSLFAEDSAAGLSGIRELLGLMGISGQYALRSEPVRSEVSLPDGSSFVMSVHPLPSTRSIELRAVVHLRETTEEKRLLTRMRQTDKLAAVGQLAAGLAHEINNPLGVIRCYAELMDESCPDEQSRADLKIILRHVEQAQSVLGDMLNFSRMREPCPGPCDINEHMREIFEIFRPQAKAARVEFTLETEPGIPEIHTDKAMLEQVVINLLLNALDAVQQCRARGEGAIILRTRRDRSSDQVIISVEDNGPGIPDHVLPQIFEPFFTTKDPGSGTGLGLTIAFGLISDMGGILEAQSPLHETGLAKGTAFRITLSRNASPNTSPNAFSGGTEHDIHENGPDS